jgi:hypothetical protein
VREGGEGWEWPMGVWRYEGNRHTRSVAAQTKLSTGAAILGYDFPSMCVDLRRVSLHISLSPHNCRSPSEE